MYTQGGSQYGVTGEYRACIISHEINIRIFTGIDYCAALIKMYRRKIQVKYVAEISPRVQIATLSEHAVNVEFPQGEWVFREKLNRVCIVPEFECIACVEGDRRKDALKSEDGLLSGVNNKFGSSRCPVSVSAKNQVISKRLHGGHKPVFDFGIGEILKGISVVALQSLTGGKPHKALLILRCAIHIARG